MNQYDVDNLRITLHATCPFCGKTVSYDGEDLSADDGYDNGYERFSASLDFPAPPGWVRREFKKWGCNTWKYSCSKDCG